jgi:hypothetical protein
MIRLWLAPSRLAARPTVEALEDRYLPSVNVLTGHNDNSRDGLNAAETVLTPADVNSGQFGKLFSVAVDGQVYAQPLVMSALSIPGQGTHDVVFVATEHDSLYAFDANLGTLLWHDSFINPAAGVTTVPSQDVSCNQIAPEIGITDTPVIDPGTGTLYLVAMTKEVSGSVTSYVQRLHALSVTTGAEKFGGPVAIQASVPGAGDGGSTVPFIPKNYKERAGLVLSGGVVYVSFASHCDITPAHGWVMGYNATTLQQVSVFCTAPNTQLNTVWMSNGGLATDAGGNIYFVTGNGPTNSNSNGFNPGAGDYAETVIKLNSAGTSVSDYFTPFNWQQLDAADEDFGSGGVLLLDQPGAAAPHLLVTAGKEGKIYLINRDSMGQFHSGSDSIVQELPGAIGGEWGSPAYFNNTVYYGGVGDALKAFTLSNGLFNATPASHSATSFAYPGTTPSVSANGTSNGIVWAIENASHGVLHAYDATNLATELYNSDQAGSRDQLDAAVKFTTPTIANGKVFVGTQSRLTVFGELLAAPTVKSAAVNGGSAALSGAQRSMVDSIAYTFDHPVALAAGAFTIALHPNVTVNGSTGQTVGTLPALSWSSPDGGLTWVVTFSGASVVNGSIADGVYDLTLNHAAVTDAQGHTLAADKVDTFYRLYGDTNGDGTVNNADTFNLRATFGLSTGDAGYLAYLDYDGNGTVNNADVFQFRNRFGTTFSNFTATI